MPDILSFENKMEGERHHLKVLADSAQVFDQRWI